MPIPVVLLGRLAVDISCQKRGLGKLLLLHALWQAQQVSKRLGVYAVEVDALNDQARDFYLKYGFTPLYDNLRHLYIAMKTIEMLDLDFEMKPTFP